MSYLGNRSIDPEIIKKIVAKFKAEENELIDKYDEETKNQCIQFCTLLTFLLLLCISYSFFYSQMKVKNSEEENHPYGGAFISFKKTSVSGVCMLSKNLLMADTVKRFHADQKAQKELEELREKMTEMEKLLSNMAKVPGYEKYIKKTAKTARKSLQ